MKSGKNFFVCNRSLFKHPFWYAEKFTKGQAWIDLFGNANHSQGWFEKNGQRVDIKRGQTGRSIESLSEDWQWSRNKVKRFLKRLEDDLMIERKPNHLTTVITICNYDKFQFDEKTNELPNEPSDEPSSEPPDELQTKKKGKRIKKGVNTYSNEFEEVWKITPKRDGARQGKKSASDLFEKLGIEDKRKLYNGLRNYSLFLETATQKAMDLERFIRKRFFDDYQKKINVSNSKSIDDGSAKAARKLEETQKLINQ